MKKNPTKKGDENFLHAITCKNVTWGQKSVTFRSTDRCKAQDWMKKFTRIKQIHSHKKLSVKELP